LSDAGILKVQDIPEAELLGRALTLAARTLHAEHAFILYADRTGQTIAGHPMETAPLLEWLAEQGTMAFLGDTERTEQIAAVQTWRQLDARFVAAAPLCTGCVHVGYLCVYGSKPRPELSQDERETLDGLTHVLGALVDMRLLASDAMFSQMQARESEQRFRSMADNAPLPIWSTDADGFNEYVNQAWRQLTGSAGAATRFEDWIAFVHPDDRARFRETWQKAAGSNQPFELEYRVTSAEGERWVQARGVPRFLANGNFSGYIGCCTDVTRHHQRERELEGERNSLSPVLESSSRVVVVNSPEGVVERYNGTAAQVLGLAPEHVGQTRLRTLCLGFDDAFEATFADVRRTGKEATLRACLAAPGNSRHWFEWTLRPALDEDGQLRHIVATGRDLTAGAKADQVLRQLAAVVEASEDAIYYMQPDGTVMTWNGAAERIFGYRAEEIVGKNIAALYPQHCLGDLQAILAQIDSGQGLVNAQTQRLHKSGRIVDIALTASLVRDENGQIVGKSSVVRDVTEAKRRERELRQQEALCRALIENALDLVIVVDASGTIRFESRSSKPLLGYEPEEMVGASVFHFIHPDDSAGIRAQLFDSVRVSGRVTHLRIRVRHKYNGWVTLDVAAKNLLDSEVGGILVNGSVTGGSEPEALDTPDCAHDA
jgi:PAS domain S-box-containing protein